MHVIGGVGVGGGDRLWGGGGICHHFLVYLIVLREVQKVWDPITFLQGTLSCSAQSKLY